MPRRNRSAYRHYPQQVQGAPCPACGYGTLRQKEGKFGAFLSCSQYPGCGFTQSVAKGKQESRQEQEQEQQQQQEQRQEPKGPAFDVSDAGAQIADILARIQTRATVDESAVKSIVESMLAHAKVTPIQYNVDSKPVAEVGPGSHAVLRDICERLQAGFRNIWLTGPSGCGKSYLLRDLAAALAKAQGIPFAAVDMSLSGGTTEADLAGRVVQNLGDGTVTYHPSPFTNAYVTPSVILLDEVDGADSNVLLRINNAIANGGMRLPNGERIERHAWCVVLVAANTWGHGADRQYVGRNQLDATFMDRFVGAQFAMDYDRDLEARLCPAGPLASVWRLRDTMREHSIRQVVSTRAVVAAGMLSAAGKRTDDILSALTAGWSAADRQTVGV